MAYTGIGFPHDETQSKTIRHVVFSRRETTMRHSLALLVAFSLATPAQAANDKIESLLTQRKFDEALQAISDSRGSNWLRLTSFLHRLLLLHVIRAVAIAPPQGEQERHEHQQAENKLGAKMSDESRSKSVSR